MTTCGHRCDSNRQSHDCVLGAGMFLRRQKKAALPIFDESSDDDSLVAAAQAGRVDAFNLLVIRHERPVYNVTYRMMGNTAEAEDITQDTFLKAWQAIDSFKGGVFRPWLLRIATNRCYDRLRALSRHPVGSLTGEDDDPDIDLPDEGGNDPVAISERLDLSEALQQALDALQADQRLAIVLCDVQHYSYEDAAAIAGVPAGTIKSRVSRGRERLRRLLRERKEIRELVQAPGRFSGE